MDSALIIITIGRVDGKNEVSVNILLVYSNGRFSFTVNHCFDADVHGTRVVLKQMPPRTSCIMPRSRESLILLSSIFIAAVYVVWTFVFG